MIKKVVKRDGRVVDFVAGKIYQAAMCALKEADKTSPVLKDLQEQIADDIKASSNSVWCFPTEFGDVIKYQAVAEKIASDIEQIGGEQMTVEEIQDMVENKLMEYHCYAAARAYILYRNKRNQFRNSKANGIIDDIIATKSTDVTRENANMNADTPAGMMMKVASERTKEYTDECLLSETAIYAVQNNILHIHDKDYYPTKSLTCLQHPVDKILESGFRAGHGESRAAKRIETASILAAISMETIQNEMHGGQAIPAFDFYMAPYVRKTYIEEIKKLEAAMGVNLASLYTIQFKDYIKSDCSKLSGQERAMQHAINMTVDRVHQSMEAFIHNMNTIHSRGGNQVVFSSINYGTDTSAEGRCVIRELLNSTYQGVGNNATAIFPIQIWKKKIGVNYNQGDPNYDLFLLACKVTARRFFPNFINLDATFNRHELWRADDPKRYMYEPATMGCRTRVFEDRHGENTSVGRGNLSFSTINLPGLALEVMHLKDLSLKLHYFYNNLISMIDTTAHQLHQRYEFQCTAKAKQFPLLMSGMWVGSEKLQPNDSVEPVLKHGTLGIGFIGLAECLIALTGKHHGESEEAQKIGLEIIRTMKRECDRIAESYDLNFSILATPAEGLSGKFVVKDRKKYGVIPGVTDKDYYTNSNHVPVYYKCSAAHKAAVEGPYHELTRGGHIFYVEMDSDATKNIDAILDIVSLMDEYNIGYASVNHNRNRCLDCNYEDASENLEVCPCCGGHNIDKLQRITGYLVGTTDRWNKGKLAELKDRVTHGF